MTPPLLQCIAASSRSFGRRSVPRGHHVLKCDPCCIQVSCAFPRCGPMLHAPSGRRHCGSTPIMSAPQSQLRFSVRITLSANQPAGARPHDTLDRKCRRNFAGGLSQRCERAGELRSDTTRTGAHRLLPRPKSVLSWTIGSCRCESACASRRRVVPGNYRNRSSETHAKSATWSLTG